MDSLERVMEEENRDLGESYVSNNHINTIESLKVSLSCYHFKLDYCKLFFSFKVSFYGLGIMKFFTTVWTFKLN